MARVTVDDALDMVGNRFVLIRLATMRCRQLRDGAGPLINDPRVRLNKEAVIALREIAAGRVIVDNTPETKAAKK